MKILKEIFEYGCDHPDQLVIAACSIGLVLLGIIL